MSSVRWGILSTADIGMGRVIPAIQRADNCEVVAIASRDTARAAAAAEELAIPASYGTYEELLEAGNVDAVYIPLPNDMHAEWVIRAASAGKHVLCEKPLALSVAQAERMADACHDAGVKFQEAMMYRNHPMWVVAVRLVRTGRIGDLVAVQSWFSIHNDDPRNIRNRAENGGGAVMDLGCYNISVARLLFGAEPERVESVVRRDPETAVDVVSSVLLEFPDGGQSTFTCSLRAHAEQWVQIVGTAGRIELAVPFNPQPDGETSIRVATSARSSEASVTETIVFPPVNQYTIQAELFAKAVLDNTPVPVPISDAIANLRVVEAILSTA